MQYEVPTENWSLSTIQHHSLRAELLGRALGPVAVWRGIKYARIPERFALAEPIDDWEWKTIDCSNYGPRSPQNYVDVGHLLRIPEDHVFEKEPEDEFECLNLDVTGPATVKEEWIKKLPVVVWIHGGSQVMTFGSGASRVCDTYTIVKDACWHSQDTDGRTKPIIVVSVQYRLNMFAFGDGKGPKNLALKDQRLAIEWVRKHISEFGGDPENITLAGESAGAVYVHAHIVTDAPIRQAILSSGSLGLSPPQPLSRGEALIAALEKKLGNVSLKEAPTEALLNAQEELNVNSLWLQMEPELEGWENKTGKVQGLLIGDVEYESVIWRNGIEAMNPEMVVDVFDQAGGRSVELRRLYNVSKTRPTPTKTGALDFINDVRYTLPIRKLSELWRAAEKPVFSYVVDQANPWQSSSRAHHAVDLLFLFGGFDLSFNAAAAGVGAKMREKWISFVNGEAPWQQQSTFAFGPFGECKALDAAGFAARRRVRHMDVLQSIEPSKIVAVFGGLAGGRISLLN